MSSKTTVICGAGGFIGGHLVRWLKTNTSAPIRAVDIKPLHEWYQRTDGVDNLTLDLQRLDACRSVMRVSSRGPSPCASGALTTRRAANPSTRRRMAES